MIEAAAGVLCGNNTFRVGRGNTGPRPLEGGRDDTGMAGLCGGDVFRSVHRGRGHGNHHRGKEAVVNDKGFMESHVKVGNQWVTLQDFRKRRENRREVVFSVINLALIVLIGWGLLLVLP